MNNEKAIYLEQWKDQEKCPDFEPVLIEILDKLERLEAELKKKDQVIEKAENTLKTVINSAMSFMTLGDRHNEEGQKIIEARQYFQDMGLNKWKEIARQAYKDQQLQDNEGGCGEPVGFVTGFIEACKQRQSEIERLEKENTELKKAYARNIEAMTGQISNDLLSEIKKYPTALPYICELRKEIERLEKELQATREQLEKATNLLRLQLYAISPSDITSTERLVKDFLSKNKQKDEVK